MYYFFKTLVVWFEVKGKVVRIGDYKRYKVRSEVFL